MFPKLKRKRLHQPLSSHSVGRQSHKDVNGNEAREGKSADAPYEVGQSVGPISKRERGAPRGLVSSSQLCAEMSGRLGYQTPYLGVAQFGSVLDLASKLYG